jgi:molybdenum cofactor biosynthesis enzyme MoaA
LDIKEHFARAFDEDWYLATYRDAAEAISTRELASGLEHFIRHGRREGRAYKLKRCSWPQIQFRAFKAFLRRWTGYSKNNYKSLPNTIQCLIDYSLGQTKVTVPPVEVVVVVSTICNLSCVMCPHGMKLVHDPKHMPLAILERASQTIATAARMIVSGLAEPLIAPAFWHILEVTSHRKDIFIRVNSNGHFLTDEKAIQLLDSRLTEISFSLDAATSETYGKIRGSNFNRLLLGIRRLLLMRAERPACQLKIYLNMTLMKDNLHEAAAFVEMAHNLGVDAVVLSQLFSFGDRPDWVVEKKSRRFIYSEQMLIRVAEEARHQILRAKKRAEDLHMRIIYQSNVEWYLEGIRQLS